MKRNVLGTISAILLASAGIVTGLALPAVSHAAAEHQHEAHDHGSAPGTLELNAGHKWETDAPLRKAMGAIRQRMAAALHDIHERRLAAAGYASLARKIEREVGKMIAQCKLEAKADAQLHLIIADLLAGAEQMAAQTKTDERRKGAVKVLDALEQYNTYFDDPRFKPIAH